MADKVTYVYNEVIFINDSQLAQNILTIWKKFNIEQKISFNQ